MSKKAIALAITLALSLSLGTHASVNHCDHCTYDTYRVGDSSTVDGCITTTTVELFNVCKDCGYEWTSEETYTSGSHTAIYHGVVCDGSFWYELTDCSVCDATIAYESGYGCGCGQHH